MSPVAITVSDVITLPTLTATRNNFGNMRRLAILDTLQVIRNLLTRLWCGIETKMFSAALTACRSNNSN